MAQYVGEPFGVLLSGYVGRNYRGRLNRRPNRAYISKLGSNIFARGAVRQVLASGLVFDTSPTTTPSGSVPLHRFRA